MRQSDDICTDLIYSLGISFVTMLLSLGVGLLPQNATLLSAKRTLLMIALPVRSSRSLGSCQSLIYRQLSFVISSIYWTLMLFLPHLILQLAESSSSDEAPAFMMIPLSTDLALHLAPVVALVTDFFLLERKYTAEESTKAPAMVLIYGICYASLVEYCAPQNGFCMFYPIVSRHPVDTSVPGPYPFLNQPFQIRLVIYGIVMSIAFGAFKALNRLHS